MNNQTPKTLAAAIKGFAKHIGNVANEFHAIQKNLTFVILDACEDANAETLDQLVPHILAIPTITMRDAMIRFIEQATCTKFEYDGERGTFEGDPELSQLVSLKNGTLTDDDGKAITWWALADKAIKKKNAAKKSQKAVDVAKRIESTAKAIEKADPQMAMLLRAALKPESRASLLGALGDNVIAMPAPTAAKVAQSA
jgi:hypothetical protein